VYPFILLSKVLGNCRNNHPVDTPPKPSYTTFDHNPQKKVRAAVEKVLDENLPDSYDRVLFRKKCDNVYELIFDYASKGQKWAA
jgi:hypothetical protein